MTPQAPAAVSSYTTSGSVSPAPLDGTFIGVSLSFGFDAGYTGGFSPVPKDATFQFDNDIAIDPAALPTCPPQAIANLTTAQARAACSSSRVGAGTATYNGGASNGVLTAFNGTPSGGHPTVLAHIDVNNGSLILVLVGVIDNASLVGDLGSQIDFTNWPNTPGFVTTHFAVTLDNLDSSPGHHYVSARCVDTDRTLNFASDATYYDMTTRTATAMQPCAPTGERAAALKKCKKKHRKKARRKCRKKAKLLPV